MQMMWRDEYNVIIHHEMQIVVKVSAELGGGCPEPSAVLLQTDCQFARLSASLSAEVR